MSEIDLSSLTERQKRELDYHREHAEQNRQVLSKGFSWDVLENPKRKWWNAYWQMFAFLVGCDLKGKRVLVVGCGFGDDALRVAKLGANVSAFDLSEASLAIAGQLAKREGLEIDFKQMPAEALKYPDNTFDFILARDILHHVDIPKTMQELVRVAKKDALFIVNEIYSHSVTDLIRNSAFVSKILYPRMRALIYGKGKPYITEDERKLTETDLCMISKVLGGKILDKHFNFLATRILPGRIDFFAKADFVLLAIFRPFARLLAGRVLFAAHFKK